MEKQKEVQLAPAGFSEDFQEDSVKVELIKLFHALLRSWKLILISVILGALMAGIYTTQFVTPLYEATSKLYVLTSKDSAINLSDLQFGAYLTSDYQEVFKTWEVHEQVNQNLGLDYSYGKLQSMLNITNPNNTRILLITVRSYSAEEATNLANEYALVAKKYIADIMRADEPSILSVALKPLNPSSPSLRRNIALGVVLGMLVSFSIVFFRFLLDDRLKNSDDILKYTGLSTLAVVPVQKKPAGKSGVAPDSAKRRNKA